MSFYCSDADYADILNDALEAQSKKTRGKIWADEDPPCTCTRVDVDLDDARGCELHDERSAYNREARRLEADKLPAKAVESESGDCPF